MFKALGCIFVLASSVMIFSRKIISAYFTCRMMEEIAEVCKKILYERNANLTYSQIFDRTGFDCDVFLHRYSTNPYTDRQQLHNITEFIKNLGRHDNNGEEKYILHNMQRFSDLAQKYHTQYCENKKVYPLYGFSLGIFAVIIFF